MTDPEGPDEPIDPEIDDTDAVAALPRLQGIADTVGGATVTALLPKLAPGGRLGSVLGEPPGAKEKGIQVRAIETRADPARLAQLAQEVASGTIVVPIVARFPLARVLRFRLPIINSEERELFRPVVAAAE